MATMKDAPRGSKPPGLGSPHSHTHMIIRHAAPRVAAGDGHPRVPKTPGKGMSMGNDIGFGKGRGR